MDFCCKGRGRINLRYKESVLCTLSLVFIGSLFTPLSETIAWVDYIMVGGAGILFGAGIYFRGQSMDKSHNEVVNALKAMTNQQKELFSDVMNSNDLKNTSLQELKESVAMVDRSINEGLKKIQVSLNGDINQEIKRIPDKIDEKNKKFYDLFDQQSHNILEEMKASKILIKQQFNDINDIFTKSQQQVLQDIVSIVKQGNNEAADFYDSLLRESKQGIDSIYDLESKLEQLVNYVLDEIETGNETLASFVDEYTENKKEIIQQFEELNENLINYQIKVKQASEEIRKYRDYTEQDILERTETLKNLVTQLSEMTSQLADSKYFERQKALEVQKKLVAQFERLKERE